MTGGFLSFNNEVAARADLKQFVSSTRPEADSPLRDSWVLWEQSGANTGSYSDCTRPMATIKTVSEFWRVFESVPQPSVLLLQNKVVSNDQADRTVTALMLFREGVKPEWEDPGNSQGGHVHFHFKTQMLPGQLDEYWNNLVLGMIGAVWENHAMVQGIRLVDKVSMTRGAGVRFEIWFGKPGNEKDVQNLRHQIVQSMTRRLDGSQSTPPPRSEIRFHNAQ